METTKVTLQGAICHCLENPEFIKEFNRLTHSELLIDPRKPIEKLIDQATGYDEVFLNKQWEYFTRFMLFVKDFVWATLPNNVRGELF